MAWIALNHSQVLDHQSGVFSSEECIKLIQNIAALIPHKLPYRWPWFPFSQEADEAILSFRWMFENRAGNLCPYIARIVC